MSAPVPHVAILMASHNGARFIAAQIASIIAQTWTNWSLWISDDGSTDATLAAIEAMRRDFPALAIQVLHGPQGGCCRNFLSLICNPAISADLVALADQDDVWHRDKIARAVAALAEHRDGPALYGARTMIVDQNLRPVGLSPRFRRRPSFGNALVQSIAGGNTMVFNAAARDLVRRAGPHVAPVGHDWWLYQLVSGAGGAVVYDPYPVLDYRQHGANLVGANIGLKARLSRIRALADGRFRAWNAQNLEALASVRDILTPEAQHNLDDFARLRRARGVAAVAALRKSALSRQTRKGDLSLAAAAAAGLL